jgi:hypothetical protein
VRALKASRACQWQSEYSITVPANDAFRVENVDVGLVPIGTPRVKPQSIIPRFCLSWATYGSVALVRPAALTDCLPSAAAGESASGNDN